MAKAYHPTMHQASKHAGGRIFSQRHNDREGEVLDVYAHIDSKLTPNNLYRNILDGPKWHKHGTKDKHQLKDAEDTFIKDVLDDAYQRQQERHQANRQYKRLMDKDTWYEKGRKCSNITIEQSWVQVGNINDGSISPIELMEAYDLYQQNKAEYHELHGIGSVTLSSALHVDEKVCGVVTPHIHESSIYLYKDIDGIVQCGQEQCLQRSDLELPDPLQPVSRYNNLKMTYTKDLREIWLDTCEQCGINVDRAPIPDGNVNHMEKDEYIYKQNKKKQEESKQLEDNNAALSEENSLLSEKNNELLQQQIANDARIRLLEEEKEKLEEEKKKLEENMKEIESESKEKLSESNKAVLSFGKKQSKEHPDEFQQFLDDFYDDGLNRGGPAGMEFSL